MQNSQDIDSYKLFGKIASGPGLEGSTTKVS